MIFLVLVWVTSPLLSSVQFSEIDPRSDAPIKVKNMLAGANMASFLSRMVTIFTSFHPLGVVLVALLGVGVAEHTGFINAGLKAMLSVTSRALLTPMLILVAVISHTAADAGYVLVIPFGAVIFYAAGRHPLAGIAAAFAGVSGGFSANFSRRASALLAPIVPMLMQLGLSPELTQAAHRVGDSTTNILTPLMPYFPLVVVFCQRCVRSAGIGTVVSMMLPYSTTFLITWSLFLTLLWALGVPLGLQAPYTYP